MRNLRSGSQPLPQPRPIRVTDWLPEVWRVKEELLAAARRMGTRKYVAAGPLAQGRVSLKPQSV